MNPTNLGEPSRPQQDTFPYLEYHCSVDNIFGSSFHTLDTAKFLFSFNFVQVNFFCASLSVGIHFCWQYCPDCGKDGRSLNIDIYLDILKQTDTDTIRKCSYLLNLNLPPVIFTEDIFS